MPDLLAHFGAADEGGLEGLRRRGYCTDEWDRWQQGQCGTYAHALTQMKPGLRFGSAGTEDWPDSHFFAHDDTHAYDSAGRHPLPYRGVHGDLTYNDLDQDPEDWGIPGEESGPEGPEQNVADAQAHARRNRILEGGHQHTAAARPGHDDEPADGPEIKAAPYVEPPSDEGVREHMFRMHGLKPDTRLAVAPDENLRRVHDSEHRVPEYQNHQHAFPTDNPESKLYPDLYVAETGSSASDAGGRSKDFFPGKTRPFIPGVPPREAAARPQQMAVSEIARLDSEYGPDDRGEPVTMADVARLTPAQMASDRYEPHELEALVEDVRHNGVREPIEIRDGSVTNGHHRYWAAARAGLTHVPVTHTAAARPGRGQKTCPCCKGNGSHGDGSECDPCDGSGLLHSNEPDVRCPGQPQPKRRHWREAGMPDDDYDPDEEPSGSEDTPMSPDVAHTHNQRLLAFWHAHDHVESPEFFGEVGPHCEKCVQYGLAGSKNNQQMPPDPDYDITDSDRNFLRGHGIEGKRKVAGMPRPNYDPSEELPEGRGIFYRVHLRDQPLDEAHARSKTINGGDVIGQRGYSAFASPHHLSQYMDEYGWIGTPEADWNDRDVIAFHGKQVGRGEDNEPLVVPEANPHCCGRVIHSQLPWEDFEHKIWDENPPERIPFQSWKYVHDYAGSPRQKSVQRHYRKETDRALRRREAAHDPDELPPDPGTAPIPEGHVRLWHYTPLQNVPSIREHGLQREYARGDSGNGDLTDPSAGMWASTSPPKDILDNHSGNAAVVEFHAHPREISQNAESPWRAENKREPGQSWEDRTWDNGRLREWNEGHHHVIMRGSVDPSQIVAIHEPWHGSARYMRKDDPTLQRYQWVKDDYASGGNDHLEPYIRGLRALERQGFPREAAYVQMPEPDEEGRYKYVDHPGVETRDELLAHMSSDEHYGSRLGIGRSEKRLRDLHEWDHRNHPQLHESPDRWTSFDFMGHRYMQHKDDPGISPEDHALIHAMGFEGSEPHTHDAGHRREAAAGGETPYQPDPQDHELFEHMKAFHSWPRYMGPDTIANMRREHEWRHDPNVGPEPFGPWAHQHALPKGDTSDRWRRFLKDPASGTNQSGGSSRTPERAMQHVMDYFGDEDDDLEWRPDPPDSRRMSSRHHAAADEPLPVQRGLWYRSHPGNDYDLSLGKAVSYPLEDDDGNEERRLPRMQQGLSALAHPWHLKHYLDQQGWTFYSGHPETSWFFGRDWDHYDPRPSRQSQSRRSVIAFHGREIGRGYDDEPLIRPQADHSCCGQVIHDRMPWEEFTRRLAATPHPKAPWTPEEAARSAGERLSGERGRHRRQSAFTPRERIFGPTYGLDHRLFEGERMRPQVRQVLLAMLEGSLEPVLGPHWHQRTRAYLMGSQASKWTSPSLEGNGDLDVIIAIDPRDPSVDPKRLNGILRATFDEHGWHPPFDPDGTYDLTGYVNQKAWLASGINPYAAYDLLGDSWAVEPPDMPGWSADQFAQGPALFQEGRALAGQVRAVLRLPEPFRSQEARRLWAYVKGGRDADFSEGGLGWQGSGNALEKMLDQMPGQLVIRLKELAHRADTGDYGPVLAGAQGEVRHV